MLKFTRSLMAAIGLATSVTAGSASAATISPGAPVLWNFSFSSPYDALNFFFAFNPCTQNEALCNLFSPDTDQGTITVYEELNGMGTARVVGIWGDTGSTLNWNSFAPLPTGLADGNLSVLFTASSGVIDGVPRLQVRSGSGPFSDEIFGVVVGAVPEAGTLTLLGAALVAAGMVRRRRRSS